MGRKSVSGSRRDLSPESNGPEARSDRTSSGHQGTLMPGLKPRSSGNSPASLVDRRVRIEQIGHDIGDRLLV